MVNHPNRSKRMCWAQFLPEIGDPMLVEMRRIKELERQASEARKAIVATIYEKWTRAEILAAKRQANASLLTKAF